MGASRSDPRLEALIALLDGDAEGRMSGASTFIVDDAEGRRAHDADDPSISPDPIADGGHQERLPPSRTAVNEEEGTIWVFQSLQDRIEDPALIVIHRPVSGVGGGPQCVASRVEKIEFAIHLVVARARFRFR